MPRNLRAVKRRMQVSEAWRNIAKACEAIMAVKKCSKQQAMAEVFADRDLLARCHSVTPLEQLVVPQIESTVAAQNG